MSDVMRSVPFKGLLERVFGELKGQGSVFGIPEAQFHRIDRSRSVKVFSEETALPIGPAAGPHTQLAQNIVASYLVGARFIELKTVQVMDTLEIAKPCIDARDEGYNVEWSTEYTLPKAFDEYLKAWVLLHGLDILFSEGGWEKPSFIFNMSVGYDLAGIKTEKMQRYLDSMADSDREGKLTSYVDAFRKAVEDGILKGTGLEKNADELLEKLPLISKTISPSVTISTMHGCPPAEIESICSYMLTEKKLDTFVKLNPTLLGYDEVRSILDSLGYDYVTLRRESFERDLQWGDAVDMLRRLRQTAREAGRGFGVKLTNTLGAVNDQGHLPGDEMYMSGRALLPISSSVAKKISLEFDGAIPISYSGGADAANIAALFDTGIRPITVATEMLRPGGYLKMDQMAKKLEEAKEGWKLGSIDVSAVIRFNEAALRGEFAPGKEKRGTDSVKLGRPLSPIDCYVAPCVESCPIHQDIPEYVYLMGEGKYAEALAVIYDKNALPNITGWICDHQCQRHCARMEYEGPIAIREIKKIAAEKGWKEFRKEIWTEPGEPAPAKAAVVGAGPAGLSACYFLARAGFDVHVFEREKNAGGVVANVIPEFRIPSEVVKKDIDFVMEHGVNAHWGAALDDIMPEKLKGEGFEYVFYAMGAEKPKGPGVAGKGRIVDATSFLKAYKLGEPYECGKSVVVMGGGNTTMDAARAARRLGAEVTVAYRRSEAEMPADREEFLAARADGVSFRFLTNPKTIDDDKLELSLMALGEKDKSGRRRPVDTGETETIDCDLLVSAIGEDASNLVLDNLQLESEGAYKKAEGGLYVVGDSASGPSTVVRAMASARQAVDACIDDYLSQFDDEDGDDECCCGHDHEHHHDHECGCGHDHHHHDDDDDEEEADEEAEALEEAEQAELEDKYFADLVRKKATRQEIKTDLPLKDFLKREAARCMECSYLCNRCVDVCPNRANVAIDMRDSGLFDDPFQVVHIDAYCNECGNCETFCPYDGGPYKKKFTIFADEADFKNSTNEGFFVEGKRVTIRQNIEGHPRLAAGSINKDMELEIDTSEEYLAIISEIFISYPYLLGQVDPE